MWGVGGGVEEPRMGESCGLSKRKTRSGRFSQDRSGCLRRTQSEGPGRYEAEPRRMLAQTPRNAAEDNGASDLEGQTPDRL